MAGAFSRLRTVAQAGFRVAVEASMKSQIEHSLRPTPEVLLRSEAQDRVQASGMEVLEVLKIRPHKGRSVILCEHPEWGACVYKAHSSQAPPGLLFSHLKNMRIIAERQSPLFPRVHLIGEAFTVEEYIAGAKLTRLGAREWAELDLRGFLSAMRDFGAESGAVIGRRDARLIIHRYVRKSIDASRYAVRTLRPTLVAKMLRDRRLVTLLRQAHEAAEGATLPCRLVNNDLHRENIVRATAERKLCVIDVETQGPGFFGTDCAWFLATATRTDCPVDLLEQTCTEVCTDRFQEASGSEPLMQCLLAFSLRVLRSYAEADEQRRKAEALLATVERKIRNGADAVFATDAPRAAPDSMSPGR